MSDLSRASLFEKYRPQTWADVVGQEKLVGRLRQMAERTGLAGRAYWLSGPSGAGKTTIARLIAAEIADPFCMEEIDAADCTPARLKDIERTSQLRGLGTKTGRAYLVNESHGLSKASIRQLLVMLERIPPHCAWVFTTTSENEEQLFEDCLDASPLLSRCIRLTLARRDLAKPFAERARWIAEQEGLNGKSLDQYVRLIQKHRQNLRAALQEIESGAMTD